MTVIVWPAVGVASRDRVVEFLFGDGGPLRPARHDLDRREHQRAGIAGEQPHREVVAGHPDGQPQVVQGGTTADDELAAQGRGHREPPVPFMVNSVPAPSPNLAQMSMRSSATIRKYQGWVLWTDGAR